MKKKDKYLKGFSLVEMLIVMGIFIILSFVGFNGFLSIRESFIARENVELIIQDIESTKLKAMNMEGGKDATWIYGFGIDFRLFAQPDTLEDYKFIKWCSPVKNFGDTVAWDSKNFNITEEILPSYFVGYGINFFFASPPLPVEICNDPSAHPYYLNAGIPVWAPISNSCEEGCTAINNIEGETTTLLSRETNQIEILDIDNNSSNNPAILLFESLTGRAIIYEAWGSVLNYSFDLSGEIIFEKDNFVPLDIVIKRKRSAKFDLITVYPISGEVIHHVYSPGSDEPAAGDCTEANLLDCFVVDGVTYKRYGVEQEINSFRD